MPAILRVVGAMSMTIANLSSIAITEIWIAGHVWDTYTTLSSVGLVQSQRESSRLSPPQAMPNKGVVCANVLDDIYRSIC